ncbi:hypothetical protein D3C84_223490 [compost metagenome]
MLQGFQVDLQHSGDVLTLVQRQQVDQRTTASGARGLRNLIGFQPVHLALAGEQQQCGVTVGNQQVSDVVLVLDTGGRLALAATTLRLISAQRLRFGVTGVGDGHHPLFFGDQVTQGQIQAGVENLGAPGIAELGLDRFQFFANHFHQAHCAGEDADQLADLGENFLVFGQQLLVLQAGQAVQAQLEDGLGLLRRQVVLAVAQAVLRLEGFRTAGIGAGAFDHGFHRGGFPGGGNQRFLGFGRARRGLDQGDHRVDVGQRNGLAFEDMATLTRLAQFEHGAPGNHFAAVQDEGFEHVLEIEDFRLAVDQRHHVDAEHALHLGLGVEVVEDHLRHFAAAQLDDDAHAVLVGFVAQLGDAFELLLFNQLGDLLDQARLVQLVRQLADDDLLTAADLVDVFNDRPRTHIDAPATGAIGLDDAGTAVDDRRRGEVRARDVLHQFIDRQRGVVDQRQAAVDHFREVVRRDVGGHAHGDTAGAVDQQVGDLGRHDCRDLLGAVVVGHPVDGFLVQIGEQLVGQLGHAHFGVTHGGGVVAVHRTEVALTVDQQVAQGEGLGHTDDGVVHRGIAMRVVLTDHVTDHAGGLLVCLVPVVAQLAHRKQHPTVHGLQAIACIRQGAPDDHAHRVVEVGLLEFVFDIDREDFFGQFAHE